MTGGPKVSVASLNEQSGRPALGVTDRSEHAHVVDLDAATITSDRPVQSEQAAPAAPDPRLTHLLRLSLDLQLDAMLFMLGAAATHNDEVATPSLTPTRTPAAASGTASGTAPDVDEIPWGRWVAEDLELTRCLASTAAELGLALPPTLGRAGRHTDSRQVAEDLIARYEFMSNLLGDLLGRAADSTPRSLMGPVHEALIRSQSRLVELRDAAQHSS
jgi:hypothetical protein